MTYYKPNYEDFGCCHIKLYAFHYFSVCANICPIDTIPRVILLFSPFLYTHWILHLLDFSTLYALPHRFTTFSCPLPLSSYKEKTCGKGVRLPENKENQKKDLYCLSFLYLLFQVSNRMKIIETKDLFSLFSLFSFWGSRKIKKMNMFFLYFLYFLFKAPGK